LRKRGITLIWRVRDIPRIDSLTPQNVLHILRILQEAFTNIIKHAKAKTITVRTGSGRDHVFIEVLDDGCGFVCNREGRGLVNMRKRARALSAQMELTSTASGTRLILQIPRAAKPSLPDGGRDQASNTMRVALSS